MGTWVSMKELPTSGNCRVLARDADGNEHHTFLEYGCWVHAEWRENEDRDEHLEHIWWEPIEYWED